MSTIHVLVVDDEPGIRSGVSRVLSRFKVSYPFLEEDFDFHIFEAETAEEGLKIIENEKVDIVLLDNKLPGMQGVEMLDILNKKQLDIAITMITSYASLDLAVDATKKGAFNFVPKPFTPEELRTAIESSTKFIYLKRMTRQMNTQGKEVRFKFLSVLSHELKSPINAVEGYLNLMKEQQMGEHIEAYDPMINRSLERLHAMRNMLLDLLDLTRLENPEDKRMQSTVDLTAMAQVVLESFEPLAIQRNVDFNVQIENGIQFYANPNEMEIIFNNLISNAVKYNKDNGRVDITLKQSEDQILLVVQDTGIGIKEDDIARLFQEFSRIISPETKQISGSGLGLSILKKTVEKYGGTVKLESEYGKGSKFTVQLPKN